MKQFGSCSSFLRALLGRPGQHFVRAGFTAVGAGLPFPALPAEPSWSGLPGIPASPSQVGEAAALWGLLHPVGYRGGCFLLAHFPGRLLAVSSEPLFPTVCPGLRGIVDPVPFIPPWSNWKVGWKVSKTLIFLLESSNFIMTTDTDCCLLE